MMAILDSDILIDFLRKNPEAYSSIERLHSEGERLNTTSINAFELLEGAFLRSSKETQEKVENLLMSFGALGFTTNISRIAANISSELKKKGIVIDFQDIAIAAIAIFYEEKLVTRNTKHFSRIKGLKIEKW